MVGVEDVIANALADGTIPPMARNIAQQNAIAGIILSVVSF